MNEELPLIIKTTKKKQKNGEQSHKKEKKQMNKKYSDKAIDKASINLFFLSQSLNSVTMCAVCTSHTVAIAANFYRCYTV